eukprot:TRINITY_DN4953_c0_g1_i1.p1 TRINITY_DN4953_c0_g1~~TRINITY_DN4953_c0_g1_i1.p1  ORF type:complete len:510 (+),score=120.87 TRINITY_DN4953_c0_g1_i1:168-1532(+)
MDLRVLLSRLITEVPELTDRWYSERSLLLQARIRVVDEHTGAEQQRMAFLLSDQILLALEPPHKNALIPRTFFWIRPSYSFFALEDTDSTIEPHPTHPYGMRVRTGGSRSFIFFFNTDRERRHWLQYAESCRRGLFGGAPPDQRFYDPFTCREVLRTLCCTKIAVVLWCCMCLLLLVFATVLFVSSPDFDRIQRNYEEGVYSRVCIPPDQYLAKPNPKIGIIMAYEKAYAKKLGPMSKENKEEYGRKHGYDVMVNTSTIVRDRKSSWAKVKMAEWHLPKYDWLFWADTDTLIMNMDVRLEAFIDDRYDIIITKDLNGLNAGVWFIRNTPWSMAFLKRWFAQTDFIAPLDSGGGSGDQDALEHLFERMALQKAKEGDGDGEGTGEGRGGAAAARTQLEQHVKIVPQCAFNSYVSWSVSGRDGIYVRGDFLVHLAGRSTAGNRVRLFQRLQDGEQF